MHPGSRVGDQARWRRFLARPFWQQGLWLQALAVLWVVRLALWLLPTRRLLEPNSAIPRWRRGWRTGWRTGRQRSVAVVVWAIVSASAYVPKASCLIQALAARYLLRRYGRQGRLRLGIARDPQGRLQAHAWIESEGLVVLGDLPDLDRFQVFPEHLATVPRELR
jgi:hypothetical protein